MASPRNKTEMKEKERKTLLTIEDIFNSHLNFHIIQPIMQHSVVGHEQ